MIERLLELKQRFDLELDLVDIDDDPRLARIYGERVPVLSVAGHAICQYFLDESALRNALSE